MENNFGNGSQLVGIAVALNLMSSDPAQSAGTLRPVTHHVSILTRERSTHHRSAFCDGGRRER
jgi:hypothetical protein